MTNKNLKSEEFVTLIYVVIFLSIVSLVYSLHSVWQSNRLKRGIPSSLEISSTVETGTEFELIGGCGAGVFRLTSAVGNKIKLDGLKALVSSKKARDFDMYYTEWQKTPLIRNNENFQSWKWTGGIACGIQNSQLRQNIESALKEPGSYYTISEGGGILVLPHYSLVIISINGGR
jgi:hypothetical protein